MDDLGISLLIRFFHIPDVGLYIAGTLLGVGVLAMLEMMWKFVVLRKSLTPVTSTIESMIDYDTSAVQFQTNSEVF